MSPVVTTFAFEIVNFLLLVGLLSWLFFKPVRAALQARQDAEKQRTDELAARAEQVERARGELDERLKSFENETARIRADQLAAVAREAATLRAQAHEAVVRERDAFKRSLVDLERGQVDQLSTTVASVARETVARLLATLDAPDLETSLIRAASRRLQSLGETQLGVVIVESGHPLDDADRATVIGAVHGQARSVDFRVVPDIGAGIRIVTSKGLIDASTRGIARDAERLLTVALARERSEVTV